MKTLQENWAFTARNLRRAKMCAVNNTLIRRAFMNAIKNYLHLIFYGAHIMHAVKEYYWRRTFYSRHKWLWLCRAKLFTKNSYFPLYLFISSLFFPLAIASFFFSTLTAYSQKSQRPKSETTPPLPFSSLCNNSRAPNLDRKPPPLLFFFFN